LNRLANLDSRCRRVDHSPVMPDTQQADSTREMALATAAHAGDRDAFGELFKLLYPRVHRTVWGMLGDEAEAHDVCQEAWIKAWRSRERFNFESTFSTWIHRIAVNTTLDALRRRRRLGARFLRLLSGGRDGDSPPDPPDAGGDNPARRLRRKELGATIEQAVAGLPDDQRTVLVLREYEGYSYNEIARLVGCRPGTVMSRLHLARRKLQTRLSKELS
jgi:RNA polymerase sigma-70 factor (ECF subfamily)